MMLTHWLDLLIVTILVSLAIQAIRGPSLFRSIIHFVVFGLAMAVAWARLGAPDLALAEAAIGAGLTGALMMVAYRRLAAQSQERKAAPETMNSRLAVPIAVAAGLLVGVIGLGALLVERPQAEAGMAVLSALPQTGLGNPITGVLLLFRGLDTLLEVAVLLTALLAARAAAGTGQPSASAVTQNPETPMIGALLAIIIPLTVLVAVHLLRAGTDETGGAFQAGAVLAAAGVLLVLTGRVSRSRHTGPLIRMGILAGLLAFILIGLLPLLSGQALMRLPGLWAVYLIETAMMVSIAMTLILLFADAGGLSRSRGG
ncbi:MAG: hydrogenase subunit MbhD domain-containing protein [Wenzhouxiangella sp.]